MAIEDNVQLNVKFNDGGAPATMAGIEKSLNDLAAAVSKLNGAFDSASHTVVSSTNDIAAGTDKATKSTVGMKRELMVLGHEIMTGNFSRVPGSFLVLAERSKSLTNALGFLAGGGGAVGIALGSVIAVAAAVGYSMYEADKQAKQFSATLALTNNYAGLTTSSFNTLAQTLAGQSTISIGKAKDALEALTATGAFTGKQLSMIGPTIVAQSRLTGEAVDKIADQFAKLAESPTKFMNAYNTAHHMFTPQQQAEIRQLEETGHQQEAVEAALRAYTNYYNGPGKQGLEDQIGLWARLTKNLGDNWNALMKATGVTPTPMLEQMQKLDAEIASKRDELANTKSRPQREYMTEQLEELMKKRVALNDKYFDEMKKSEIQKQAAANSKMAQDNQEYIDKLGIKTSQGLERALEQLRQKIKDAQQLKSDDPKYDSQLLDPKYQKQAEDAIRARFKNPIDDSQQREQYRKFIAQQESFIKQATDNANIQKADAKKQLDEGVINEEQYQTRLHDIKEAELAEQAKYTKAMSDRAGQEVIRTNHKQGVVDQEKYADDIKHIHNEEVLADTEYAGALAKNKRELAVELKKVDDDIAREARTFQQSSAKELAKMTMTPDEAALADVSERVKNAYASMRAAAEASLRAKNASAQQITEELDKIDKAEKAQLSSEIQYYNQKKAVEADWSVNARKDLNAYIDSATNAANQMKTLTDAITHGFENTLSQFMQTGNLSFKSLADSWKKTIDDMVAKALTAKLTQSLFGNFLQGGTSTGGSMLGSFATMLFGGGRATGGPTQANTAYLVGENGPEIMVPGAGSVIPNSALQAAGASSQTIHIHATDADSFKTMLAKNNRFLSDLVNNTNTLYNQR